MKIKALAGYCKRTQTVFLVDEKSEDGERIIRQYIQAGTAMYPLDGMPILNEDTLLAILDVPQDERSSWQVNRVDAAIVRKYTTDNMEGDREAELVGLCFAAGGYEVQPLYTPFGMVTIDAEARKPIADSKKTAQYFARRDPDSKHITIIVKNGFMLVAAISPIKKWATEKTAEYLADIANHADNLLKQNEAEETAQENAADGKTAQPKHPRPFGLLPAPQPKLEDENRRGADDLLS